MHLMGRASSPGANNYPMRYCAQKEKNRRKKIQVIANVVCDEKEVIFSSAG